MRIWKPRIPLDKYRRDKNGFIRGDRPCTKLLVHMVITPKYRIEFTLYSGLPELIESIIRNVCKERSWYIENLAVETNHVHLLIQFPPNVSVSYLAQIIKGNVSKIVRKEMPELITEINKESFWARKFFAVTVGDNDFERTKEYIESQGVTG